MVLIVKTFVLLWESVWSSSIKSYHVFVFFFDEWTCEFMSWTDSQADSCLLLSCHSLQGSHQPDNAGSHAGVKTWRPSQLDDPSKLGFNDIYHLFSNSCFLLWSAVGQPNKHQCNMHAPNIFFSLCQRGVHSLVMVNACGSVLLVCMIFYWYTRCAKDTYKDMLCPHIVLYFLDFWQSQIPNVPVPVVYTTWYFLRFNIS